ncbi:SMC-Scp complex subunit ScpB [Vagococcus penaei]|uniref:Segregation and condensation protein B n=1 Tax=Vagococcus penaei TaxID=633807 RepID=A0A1Q2D3L2_9ENTE|nr:SMC-Scp complex subunit ScpB [Vagococcus penaei]AQP52956.1 SMC-Scp complex subunit ScpB [Vagococcus penaei]RSU02585.1 SMC-Scp complex subunit ScpB [Vagococcus penaei]
MNKRTQLEALLFVSGNEGLTLNELAYFLNEKTETCFQLITELKTDYEKNDMSALKIMEVNHRFILVTKAVHADLLKEYAQSSIKQSISQAAIECLAIIAYNQPITRAEIDQIRGVKSSGPLQRLASRQLIEEKGRVEGPGRPILYGVTDYFMDYFGLKSLEDLPSIQELEEEASVIESTDLFFDRFKEKFDELDSDYEGSQIEEEL